MKLLTTLASCIIIYHLSAQNKKVSIKSENVILQVKNLEYQFQTALYARDTTYILTILDDNVDNATLFYMQMQLQTIATLE